jgi:hypothetical protein
MNANGLLDTLQSFFEIRALLRCVERLGVRVGLCGGVLRNILIREGTVAERYDSLYDFVDPFGDIDIVLPEEVDGSVVIRALFAEIPFADCHVWDLQTTEDRRRTVSRAGGVAADGLIVWLDGRAKRAAKMLVESIDPRAESAINQPLHPNDSFRFRGELTLSEFRNLIRYARLQMLVRTEGRSLTGQFAELQLRGRDTESRGLRALSRRARFEVELELAQLLLTAPEWLEVELVRGQLRNALLGKWLSEKTSLHRMLTFQPAIGERVGAILYKPSARSLLKLEFTTAEREDDNSNFTQIPWTSFTLENRGERGCCPYVDFEDGIAVVAWRHTTNEGTRRDQTLAEEDFGLLAYPIAATQSPIDVLRRNRRIPMLGFVRRGRSIVTRFDPAYLRMITGGRHATFMVGLVSVPAIGGVYPPVTEPPVSLAPSGEQKRQPEVVPAPAYA